MNHGFSSSTVLSQAWKLFKVNYFVLLAVFLSGLILGLMQFLIAQTDSTTILSVLINLLSIVVSLVIGIGWVNVVLKLIRGNSQKWEDFKTPPKIWGKVFVSQILTSIPIIIFVVIFAVFALVAQNTILAIISIIFAIVIAVYIKIRFMFLNPVAIDNQELGIIALLKKTAGVTKNHFFDLLGFGILMILVNIAGLALLLVGLLVTIPLTMIANVYVYNKLVNGVEADITNINYIESSIKKLNLYPFAKNLIMIIVGILGLLLLLIVVSIPIILLYLFFTKVFIHYPVHVIAGSSILLVIILFFMGKKR